jgi:putative membrane protein insertion efficiency factor
MRPTGSTEPQPNAAVGAAVALLRAYQGAASGRISPCRFYPSCSNYSIEAFTTHGFWRGLALSARRLVRCRPFGPHGVDLVPVPVRVHHHEAGRPC